MANSVDTPMFRTQHRETRARAKAPTYRKDLNANWTQDQHNLIVIEDDALKQKIQNVLFTQIGEEYFEPTFGSMLPYRLFEGVTDRIAYMVRGDTIGAIGTHMRSEVEVNHALCSVEALSDDEGFDVRLVYKPRFGEPVEWNFNLSKADIGYA